MNSKTLEPIPMNDLIALIVLIVASSVLIAWAVRFDPMLTVLPGKVPMQFNTALCFAGLAAVRLIRGPAGRALSWAVFSLAGLTLWQDITGINFGIDEFFLVSHLTTETPLPGRMAPSTAVGFMSLAMANLMLTRFRVLAETLLITTAGVAFVSLLGYVPGALRLYSWGDGLTSMAIHTATLQLALAGALLKTALTNP